MCYRRLAGSLGGPPISGGMSVAVPLFPGYTLAVLWDTDDTMIPGYMQKPIFEAYGVKEGDFWNDVRASVDAYKAEGVEANVDSVYLLTFLSWVHDGKFPGLSISKLTELGAKLEFHKGMPEALGRLQHVIEDDPRYQDAGIKVEHYIISQGMRQLLLGTDLTKYAKKIYGSDFLEDLLPAGVASGAKPHHKPTGEITQVANAFTSTDKTRAVFEISKGTALDPSIGVNDAIAEEDRRIPLDQMIYVADGPTDIPVWSILNKAGGKTLAVYNPVSPSHQARAIELEEQGRVQHVSPADFRPDGDAFKWLSFQLRQMADHIVDQVQAERAKRIQKPGGHLNATVAKPAPKRRVAAAHREVGRPKVIQGGLAATAAQHGARSGHGAVAL